MDNRFTVRAANPAGDLGSARFGFDAGREVVGATRQLHVSGQVGDSSVGMAGQIRGAVDALLGVLALADYRLDDIVRLGLWTTDLTGFLASWPVLRDRFAPGRVPPNTLAQVTRFATPGALVEIDAVALR